MAGSLPTGSMDILVAEATCEIAHEGLSAETLPPVNIKGFSDLQGVCPLGTEAASIAESADSAIVIF